MIEIGRSSSTGSWVERDGGRPEEASVQPGPVLVFGSGETTPGSQRAYNWLFSRFAPPVRVAVLETPAGFEPNSAQVAGRVAEFIAHHLKNYRPEVTVVPARRRGTEFGPDNPDILEPLFQANIVFAGPGSPTYAVRHLKGSLAWHILCARHRLGAGIIVASAATISISRCALPVYEIYKAGADLHWEDGLGFFAPFGLDLVFVPHWNNAEGGADLDTSRCFMGQSRFEALLRMLPPGITVVGVEEHTTLAVDIADRRCEVLGSGGAVVLRSDGQRRFESGSTFAITTLGDLCSPEPGEGIPSQVWRQALAARTAKLAPLKPSAEVLSLMQRREEARALRDYATADALRRRIAAMGWEVRDTAGGTQLERT